MEVVAVMVGEAAEAVDIKMMQSFSPALKSKLLFDLPFALWK